MAGQANTKLHRGASRVIPKLTVLNFCVTATNGASKAIIEEFTVYLNMVYASYRLEITDREN